MTDLSKMSDLEILELINNSDDSKKAESYKKELQKRIDAIAKSNNKKDK